MDIKRRDFTKMAGLGMLAIHAFPSFAATEMIKNSQSNSARVPIGLCNHSLRSLKLNAQQLIEYAIEKRLDSVLLNTFQPFESLDDAHLSKLSKIAKANDVSVYVGAGSICKTSSMFSDKYGTAEQLLTKAIRVATAFSTPVVPVRIGSIKERYLNGGIEVHVEESIKVLKSVRTRALDAGIKFAFENHAGDLRTEELLPIINEVGTDICGTLFDPANALWAMEDPMKALKKLGSTILCTSVRDVTIWETDEGATFQGMAIGEGMLDFPLYAKTMAELCPGVPLHVETISNSARPVPFLTDGFWDGFPNLPAREFADFLKLIKKGKLLEIIKPPAGLSQKEFDIDLQKSELQSSFEFLRKYCNAGLKI